MSKPGVKSDRINSTKLKSLGINWSPDLDMTPEQAYIDCAPSSRRESMGQFFTPSSIAELMTEWIAVNKPHSILDPSAGTGMLSRSVRAKLPDSVITCLDLDPAPLEVLSAVLQGDKKIKCIVDDFLLSDFTAYDAVIANPPYLRHQNFGYPNDIHEEIGKRSGVVISRLANLYVLFVLEICRRIKVKGRASIIIPSEWMNANYGQALKEFFGRKGILRKIVYFSPNTLPFEDALTTACILLLENTPPDTDAVEVIYVSAENATGQIKSLLFEGIEPGDGIKSTWHDWATLLSCEKWDRLFEVGEQKQVDNLVTLSVLARTRRGIATGANDFFHISEGVAAQMMLQTKHLVDCVGKSGDVTGLTFTSDDYARLQDVGARTKLIDFRGSLNDSDKAYVELGKARGLQQRYVLSKRSPWYSMEECNVAPIWAAVFGRRGMRFIWNKAGVSHLTTFHGVYPRDLTEQQIICLVAFLNSKPIQERAMHHRRVYGGGLIKFEPKDLLQIEVPDVRLLKKETLDMVEREMLLWDERRRTDPDAGSILIDRVIQEIMSATDPVAMPTDAGILAPKLRLKV